MNIAVWRYTRIQGVQQARHTTSGLHRLRWPLKNYSAHEITKEALQHEQIREYEKVTKQTVSAIQHTVTTETPCLQHQLPSCMDHWMPGIIHNNNTAAGTQ